MKITCLGNCNCEFVFIVREKMFHLEIHLHSECFPLADWSTTEHGQVQRQLSVSSDSKLLDDDIREEARVIMRPKKPPRPKSEVFLNKHDPHPRRKRFSAFGVSSPRETLVLHGNEWRNFVKTQKVAGKLRTFAYSVKSFLVFVNNFQVLSLQIYCT